MKILITYCMFLFLSLTTQAQISFQKIYTGAGLDTAYAVLVLNDGYLIAANTSSFGAGGSDACVVKTDLTGHVLWSKTYGGALEDKIFAMQKTSDGGFILAGTTESFIGSSFQNVQDIYLIKIDTIGNVIWSQSIDLNVWDIAYAVKETIDHGFIITGYTGNLFPGPGTMNLVKTDSLGIVTWSDVISSLPTTALTGKAVVQTADSGYALTGYAKGITAFADTDLLFIKTDPTGTIISSMVYSFTGTATPMQSYGYDMIKNTSGNLTIVGAEGGLYSGVAYIYAPFLLQINDSGSVLNAKSFSLNSGDCRAYSVVQTPDKGYLLGGQMGNYYSMMLKTDSAITTQWCYYYGSLGSFSNNSSGYSLQPTPVDSGSIITGYQIQPSGACMNLIKVNSSGQSGCNEGIPFLLGISNSLSVVSTPALLNSATAFSEFAGATLTGFSLTIDSNLCVPTIVEEMNTQQPFINIFPDPVSDNMHITYFSSGKKNITIELFNLFGDKVATIFKGPSSEHGISTLYSLKSFPSGIYFIVLSSDGKKEIRKVMKL